MRSEHRRSALPTRQSLDSTGDERLREELRRRLPPDGVHTSPPPRQEAADQTGSVAVTVDARGCVTDVYINQRWRSRLDRDGFAGALLDAYTTARQQAFEAFVLAALAAEEAGADPPQIAGELLDRTADPPRRAPTDTREWLVWIRERFAHIREEVDRVTAARAGAREHTGPHGYLTATLDCSGVVRAAGDASRIWYSDTGALREDALEVLSAAHRPAA